MNSQDKATDDLTAIKGIGPARQQWFRDSLNVRTFGDLAALTATEIETQLKADGKIAAANEIEHWITEARKLSKAAESASERMAERTEGEVVDEEATATGEGKWEWLKAFVVEFCIFRVEEQVRKQELRVYPMKVSEKGDWLDNGESKRSPMTFERGDQLYPWMVEQLGEQPWQVAEEEKMAQLDVPPAETSPVEAPEAEALSVAAPRRVEVKRISAYQPLQAETPTVIGEANQPFAGFITGDEPFTLEATFALAGTIAANIDGDETAYWAKFYVRNMATGVSSSLGDTELSILAKEKALHKVRLSKTTLPPGRYHLGVQVMLRTEPPIARHLEVPFFEVV